MPPKKLPPTKTSQIRTSSADTESDKENKQNNQQSARNLKSLTGSNSARGDGPWDSHRDIIPSLAQSTSAIDPAKARLDSVASYFDQAVKVVDETVVEALWESKEP
jgi:hypothetical protein